MCYLGKQCSQRSMHQFSGRQEGFDWTVSAFITYNQDDYGMFGRLLYLPAADHVFWYHAPRGRRRYESLPR